MKNQKPTKGRPSQPIILTAGDGELVRPRANVVTPMIRVVDSPAIDRITVVENFTPAFNHGIARLVAEADAFAAKRREEEAAETAKLVSDFIALTDAREKRSAAAKRGWATRRAMASVNEFAKSVEAFNAHADAAFYRIASGLIITPKPPTLFERIVVRLLSLMGVR